MDTNKFFKARPTAKEVFQTSDGYLFAKESDAKNHAKTLANKNVKKVVKGEKTEGATPKTQGATSAQSQATTDKK